MNVHKFHQQHPPLHLINPSHFSRLSLPGVVMSAYKKNLPSEFLVDILFIRDRVRFCGGSFTARPRVYIEHV